jgi:hypothetical protein
MIDLNLLIWDLPHKVAQPGYLPNENSGLTAQLKGQRTAYVLEGGTIMMPYGSQGLGVGM